MRTSISSAVATLGLVLALAPQPGRTETHRDFLFSDTDGYLVLRFVGIGAGGLDSTQTNEILDSEFSTMVHDRLRADLLFEDEPRDPEWAASMQPQIEEHVRHAGPEFSDIMIGCRVASCRIVMEQPGKWSVREHLVVLETVQESLEDFVAARRQEFEPGFLITAYYQDSETPHIKAFLRRTGRAVPHRVDR